MERAVLTKPKPSKRKSYASLASDGGKPCPTCYAQMEASGSTWTCVKHGKPSKP